MQWTCAYSYPRVSSCPLVPLLACFPPWLPFSLTHACSLALTLSVSLILVLALRSHSCLFSQSCSLPLSLHFCFSTPVLSVFSLSLCLWLTCSGCFWLCLALTVASGIHWLRCFSGSFSKSPCLDTNAERFTLHWCAH